ncbi:cytochrome b5 domain-containing protein [Candidatus Pacearchaeota archaeon]|nr:cytochrome b5 domain-containing protein [Candidatus Pacearchaeota archaeon]
MKKIVLAILIVLLVFGVATFVRLFFPSGNVVFSNKVINLNGVSSVQLGTSGNTIFSGDSRKISLAEISSHNTGNDCWVGYDGKVYDVTSFLSVHPGSAEAIIPHCGTSSEFTNAFVRQHGTSKVSKLMKVGVLIGDFEIIGRVK